MAARVIQLGSATPGPQGPPGAGTVVLNSNQDAGDVPEGTPEGTIVLKRYPL